MSPSRDGLTLAECRHWLGSWSSIRSPGHRVLNSTFPASRDAAVTCHTAGMDQGMRVSFIGMSHKGFGAISLQLYAGEVSLVQGKHSQRVYTPLQSWKDMLLEWETSPMLGEPGAWLCPWTSPASQGPGPLCSFRGCHACVPPSYLL